MTSKKAKPSTIEQAAEKWEDENVDNYEPITYLDVERAFAAGAEWMQAQCEREASVSECYDASECKVKQIVQRIRLAGASA